MNEKEARRIVSVLGEKNNPSEEELFLFTDAMHFLIKKNNDPEDMTYLGGVYYEQKKFDLALKYYEMAAELEYEPAISGLGYIWYYGRTGKKDYEKAFKYFSKSAELGNLQSLYKIADMYKNGYFVEKDYDKYVSIINELYPIVKKGHYLIPEIFTRLANIYSKEGKKRQAINLFKKAKEYLAQRIKYNAFWGNLNIMMWLTDDLYKLKKFNKKEFDLYDLFYLLTMPSIVSFMYEGKTYIVRSILEDGNTVIEFDGNWYRKREDFFTRATINGFLLTKLYYDLENFEVINEKFNKSKKH